MSNFQFDTLLHSSWLSAESVHMLGTIFRIISDERKIELMDNWPHMLDTFLKIEQKGAEERKANIEKALSKIETIVNDALLRDAQKSSIEAQEQARARDMQAAAEVFDFASAQKERQRQLIAISRLWHEDPTLSLSIDPLWSL